MNTGLQGKVAIVTGASRGIGKAIALAFANEGVRLVLCARGEEQLKVTEEEIKNRFHTEVIIVKANATKLNDIKRVVSRAVAKFKRIDVLVNNAGDAHVGGVFQFTDEDFENHIHLKVLGYIRTAREVIPHMQQQGGGRIINIIGTGGKEPLPTMMLSGITSGALLNFTKALAAELAQFKITVNAINPGTTETILTEQTLSAKSILQEKSVEEIKLALINSNPFQRLAKPEDVANAVIFLSSEAASFISGISVNVDGGSVRSSA